MQGLDFYVRQFRDMKVIPDGALIAPCLVAFARIVRTVLARAHARTGDAMAIIEPTSARGAASTRRCRRSPSAYADQTARDHGQLVDAVESGAVAILPA